MYASGKRRNSSCSSWIAAKGTVHSCGRSGALQLIMRRQQEATEWQSDIWDTQRAVQRAVQHAEECP